MKKVTGKVVFVDLNSGFWGIEDASGNQYRPINMPEQLKYPNREVEVKLREVEEGFSMHMWGTAVKIIAFETMTP